MQEKIIAITISILILGQAWLVRRHVGSWIFPACIFGLFWFGFTFFPLVMLFSVPIEPLALAFILCSCLVFSGTALFFNWRDVYRSSKGIHLAASYDTNFLRLAFYGLSFCVVLCIIVNWTSQGFLLKDVVFNYSSTAAQYLTKRSAGEIVKNNVSQIGVVFSYPAAILGGVIYSARRNRWDGVITLCVAFLASVLLMVVEGNKGALFLVAALFWGGVLVGSIGRSNYYILGKGVLIKLVVAGAVLLPLLIVAFWIRVMYWVSGFNETAAKIAWYLYSYTCGHLYAFSDWFSAILGRESQQVYSKDFGAHGFYTFMGLFKALGDTRVAPPGVYAEYYVYENIIQSNIYTIFRGLVQDFGLYGSLFFWIIAGLVVHAVFEKLLLGRMQAVAISIFAHFVGFVYSAFIVSFFIWNSIYASLVVTAALFHINYWICMRNAKVQS